MSDRDLLDIDNIKLAIQHTVKMSILVKALEEICRALTDIQYRDSPRIGVHIGKIEQLIEELKSSMDERL